jgi:hypothetical protein
MWTTTSEGHNMSTSEKEMEFLYRYCLLCNTLFFLVSLCNQCLFNILSSGVHDGGVHDDP